MSKQIKEDYQLSNDEATVMLIIRDADPYGIYGYDIIKIVKEKTNGQINLSPGKLYPILHRLEKKGYLKSKWGNTESDTYGTGGARRKYYQLETKGAEIIKKFLKTFPQKYRILIDASQNLNNFVSFSFL